MEQLFNDIQKQIAEKMGDTVSLIDEDCGQLEALINGEDQYPVTFPCVLISIPETIWENLKGNLQHGKTTVTVRLAFDCYDDTHYGSTQEQHAAERMRLASRLYMDGSSMSVPPYWCVVPPVSSRCQAALKFMKWNIRLP